MSQIEKANLFAALHVKGNPVILYNIWDAGSAKAVADAGAKAIATGSWGVAEAQGYADGEALPIEIALIIAASIVDNVSVPVTIDFEGGYAVAPTEVAENVMKVIEAGAVGINFEDQIVGSAELYNNADQSERISAIRKSSEATDINLFINARTDLFLKEKDAQKHAGLVESAIERAKSYEQAGANSFFVPGLTDAGLIAKVCEAVSLPVNVLKKPTSPSLNELASMGVGRVSYGPGPFAASMTALGEDFKALS